MDDARITALALRARDGDRAAAGEFVAVTQQQVWRLLVHLADASVAEELAQETYERALGSLRRYRGDAPARSWLLSIARRVAADHLRRRARRPVSPATLAEDDRPLGHVSGADPAESVAVRHALAALDPDRREAFVLTQLLGLRYDEAASVAGCPIGTIRSRVARARADLVAALGEHPPSAERPHRSG
ncbi:sigma-70 family RNA polymerase sigma factor [Actinomycetospora cinnamomea]|uniref:RNA polymerase sigma-70 factor (ECF subfamily) n=1 Tax=Actinomycetospora cinnamomea TaxID=663609 RepID=A0A2U1EVE4_9PSEU|nr:sigma-70 family RNA polymerase sigma factor [Actinomycetospora cinnamomea]PVZ03895.1 RNA polymerase sigma-70 factor (ECF subfamily) [Actinomycetospora cinnamomea]